MIAAIYTRVSTDQQEKEGTSLESQLQGCERLARELGATTILPYYTDTFTGLKAENRKSFMQLIDDAKAKRFQLLVCHSADRFARDPIDMVATIRDFTLQGISVHFVTEGSDTSPEGMLIHFVRGFSAASEHQKIRERNLRGKVTKVRSGKQITAATPYGYQWVYHEGKRTHLVVDETEASNVRLMFARLAEGFSLRKITKELDELGIPTPSGKKAWGAASVRNIVINEVYDKGERTFFSERWSKSGTEPVVIPNAAPPFVDPAIALRARKQLERNKVEAKRNNQNPEMTLLRAGFIVCENCGNNVEAQNRPKKAHPVYVTVCPCGTRSINANLVDEFVWSKVKQVIDHPELIAQALEHNAKESPVKNLIDMVEKQRHKSQALYDRYMKMIGLAETDDMAASLLETATQHRNLVKQAEERLAELQEQHESWELSQQTLRNLTQWTEKMRKDIDRLSYQRKRDLLKALDVKAHFSNEKMHGNKGRGGPESLSRIRVSMGLDDLLIVCNALKQPTRYVRISWCMDELSLAA